MMLRALITLLAALSLATSGLSGAAAKASVVDHVGCEQTLPLDLNTHEPFGVMVPCPGIRPGAWVAIEDVAGCTLNFVFQGTVTDEEGQIVDEGLFVGTAGHCVLDLDEETVWEAGQGPQADTRDGKRFGEVVYAIDGPLGAMDMDFALIRVDPEREEDVSSEMCHFGGPSGIAPGAATGQTVHHFGQGGYISLVVPGARGS